LVALAMSSPTFLGDCDQTKEGSNQSITIRVVRHAHLAPGIHTLLPALPTRSAATCVSSQALRSCKCLLNSKTPAVRHAPALSPSFRPSEPAVKLRDCRLWTPRAKRPTRTHRTPGEMSCSSSLRLISSIVPYQHPWFLLSTACICADCRLPSLTRPRSVYLGSKTRLGG
jgi:hypothetical protein